MNDNEKKTAFDDAATGLMRAVYGKEWFVKFYTTAFEIGKVKVSFVKMNTKGKTAFDVYLKVEEFRIWMRNILNGKLIQTIKDEAKAGEKYPKSYKIVTGDKGQKSVGFMASASSKYAVAVNGESTFKGSDGKDKKIYGNVPMTATDLMILADEFLLAVKAYDEKKLEAYKKGIASAASYHLSKEDEDYVGPDTEEPKTEPAPVPEANAPAPTEYHNVAFISKSPIRERMSHPGDYALTAESGEKRRNVVIPGTTVSKIEPDKWQKIVEMSEGKAPLSFNADCCMAKEGDTDVVILTNIVVG